MAAKFASGTTARAFRFDFDDLRSVAVEGALRAHATFDPTKGARWITWIWGHAEYAVQHYIRDNSGVRRSDWDSKNMQAIPISFDEWHLNLDTGEETWLDPEDPDADPEAKAVLLDMLRCLPAAHKRVVALRYAGLKDGEIARRLRIRAADVDRLLKDSHKALLDSGRTVLPGEIEHFRALARQKPVSPWPDARTHSVVGKSATL